jgi:hypothetical protein
MDQVLVRGNESIIGSHRIVLRPVTDEVKTAQDMRLAMEGCR